MADYKDLGKVYDDFFGPGGSPSFKEEQKKEEQKAGKDPDQHQENPSEDSSNAETEGSDMALSFEEKSPDLMEGLLVDIRKIREMVEADFHAIDLEAERELARSGNGVTDPEAAKEETGAASGNPAQEIQEEKPKEPEKSGMEELEELIGLTTIKEDVKELVALMKAAQLRKDQGMKTVPVSLHLVFSGNPGTGKTTVARILAKLYKEIGVLSKGQLVEVDRSGLVAGFVGQTAIKTQEKIKEALGGILFIDEAYTLSRGAENDFGQEAIDTILKAMEDHRDDFVVIVAGYTNLMEKFIHSNPGLKSRFNKFIEFPDYTADELQGIFDLQCKKYEYTLDEEAKELISAKIREMEQNKGENFANAREVRNLFEALITNQAFRISAMENPGPEELRLVTREDVVKDERKTEEEAHDN